MICSLIFDLLCKYILFDNIFPFINCVSNLYIIFDLYKYDFQTIILFIKIILLLS